MPVNLDTVGAGPYTRASRERLLRRRTGRLGRRGTRGPAGEANRNDGALSGASGRPGVSEPDQHCTHPWLRVTCGVCGEAVDALSETVPEAGGTGWTPRRLGVSRLGDDDSQALFIVARGHPDLLDQL